MASVPPLKPTLSTLAVVTFIALAGTLDSTKFLLFFMDAIPVIGIAFSTLGSEVIGFMEDIFVFGGLWLAGAFKKTKSALGPALVTFGAAVIDFVPIVNDFPVTTGAVIFIIMRSRMNDKVVAAETAHKRAAQAKHHAQQQVKIQASKRAAQNAIGMRQQAMATSMSVAQTPPLSPRLSKYIAPAPTPPSPANDNRVFANDNAPRPYVNTAPKPNTHSISRAA